MKDVILESYITDFAETNGLSYQNESDIFENFSNFICASREHLTNIDLDLLTIGGANDEGIDGAFLATNGLITAQSTDFDYIASRDAKVRAHFIFIQAKNSRSYDTGDFLKFANGVKRIFSLKSLKIKSYKTSLISKITFTKTQLS